MLHGPSVPLLLYVYPQDLTLLAALSYFNVGLKTLNSREEVVTCHASRDRGLLMTAGAVPLPANISNERTIIL